MKAVKRKLKSGAGASILISLMFFLVVMMVGAVCLVAAYNNSGRATHARDDLQEYYAVQSAVDLIREDLKEEKAKFILTPVTIVEGKAASYTLEIPDDNKDDDGKPIYGRLVYDLIASADSTYTPLPVQSVNYNLTLTIPDTDNPEYDENLGVKGKYKIGTDIYDGDMEDLDFTVVVDLWYDNGTKSYATTLTFPAYIRTVNIYDPDDETITTKLYVSWEEPQTGRQEAA